MFGYVICCRQGLEKEELERYQSLYCGLCRQLGKRFDQVHRMTLNYDLTFVALLLSALYEPKESVGKFRCMIHPFHKKESVDNIYLAYAADMTIALTYYKCLDDWQDDRNPGSRLLQKVLEKGYRDVEERYPRQCIAISESVKELRRLEQDSDSIPDDAINCSGRMLAEIFVYQEDFWAEHLRNFGYALGRFIYLMDAAVDYEKDMKSGNYNPLFRMEKKPEEIEEVLQGMIGSATSEFEKLPIVQDAHLIRNILYAGVWQKYHAKGVKKEKKHDN